MGQTGVAIPYAEWSTFNNTALISTEVNTVSFYGFRYAGIAEISDIAATATMQTSIGSFGAGIHRYGFNLFSENRFMIAYKNREGRIHYGASFSYVHISQGNNYGSAGALGVDLGVAVEIAESLWLGGRATNINQPAYGDTDENLPRELAGGISFKPGSMALITAELVKDVKFPVSFRTGLEFELFSSFFARTGVTTRPSTYSFGFGYRVAQWSVNFALQQHNPLGLSPALDISIHL